MIFLETELIFQAPNYWLMASCFGLFAMTFLGAGVIPLPVSFVVMGLAPYAPVTTLVLATLGTCLGWWVLGSGLHRHVPKKSLRVAQQVTPDWLKKIVLKWPTLSIFVTNVLPLPWDPIRVIRLSQEHDPKEMIVPLTLGRAIRYAGFVWVGQWMATYRWFFLTLMTVIILSIGYKIVESVISRMTQSETFLEK